MWNFSGVEAPPTLPTLQSTFSECGYKPDPDLFPCGLLRFDFEFEAADGLVRPELEAEMAERGGLVVVVDDMLLSVTDSLLVVGDSFLDWKKSRMFGVPRTMALINR